MGFYILKKSTRNQLSRLGAQSHATEIDDLTERLVGRNAGPAQANKTRLGVARSIDVMSKSDSVQ
jgi:hypothetical protein